MSDDPTLVQLVDDLLHWRENAIVVLGDYLEDCGFERKFEQHGGLYSRIGVIRALLNVGVICPESMHGFDLPTEEAQIAFDTSNLTDPNCMDRDF